MHTIRTANKKKFSESTIAIKAHNKSDSINPWWPFWMLDQNESRNHPQLIPVASSNTSVDIWGNNFHI